MVAQIAKLEDRLNNISCIEKIDKPRLARYVQETKESYIPFATLINQPMYADLLNKQIERITRES